MKYYSLNGEDWVIEQLCDSLGIKAGWFVDVGSWDGEYLNNCRFLLDKGWQGVMIEGDLGRFEKLSKNMEKFKVWCLNSMVRAKELDNLLQLTPIPKDFDVLSVDVDSWDYWLWHYLKHYTPKIVVIEVNGGVPDGEEWLQPEDRAPRLNRARFNGASRCSMNGLSKKKGYRLVAEPGNMIYLRNDLWR